MKRILLFGLLICLMIVCAGAYAQNTDSLRKEMKMISVDSLNMQDTSNTPTDRNVQEEQKRIANEEPRVYKDSAQVVFKDSARLALELQNRQATIRSVILPGWGQITNGRWWKVPIVYGGFVAVGLSFEFNHRNYKFFLEEVQFRLANPGQFLHEEYAAYNNESIIKAKDFYRRNRDLSVLIGLGVYAINIIDAYVDSKMFRYDISDDLSFKAGPSIQTYPALSGTMNQAIGVKLAFTLP